MLHDCKSARKEAGPANKLAEARVYINQLEKRETRMFYRIWDLDVYYDEGERLIRQDEQRFRDDERSLQ